MTAKIFFMVIFLSVFDTYGIFYVMTLFYHTERYKSVTNKGDFAKKSWLYEIFSSDGGEIQCFCNDLQSE